MIEAEKILKYGKPGTDANMKKFPLPIVYLLAWDLTQKCTTITLHKDVGQSWIDAETEALAYYGEEKFKELELHIFGGSYVPRYMRGTENSDNPKWSDHAWGTAVDKNPTKNGLKMNKTNSQFAKPEYDKYFEIMEKHGWYSLGRYRGYDYMHLQKDKPELKK